MRHCRSYHDQIIDTKDGITEIAQQASKEMQDLLKLYLATLDFISPVILASIEEGAKENWDTGEDGWDDLDKLENQFKDLEQQKMTTNLGRANFYLEDGTTLFAVMSTDRTEISIVCLLSLVLNHDLETIKSQAIEHQNLTEATADVMAETLYTVLRAFIDRLNELKRGWRQQRKDVDMQMQCFAGGLFGGLYDEVWRAQCSL